MGKSKIHAAVIGAGLSGLTSAAYLALKGVQVTLIENDKRPGGLVDTFARKGYRFEATTHIAVGFNKNGYIKPVLKKLKIHDLETVETKDLYSVHYLDEDGKKESFLLPTGIKNLQKKLINYFPEEETIIRLFFRRLKNITHDVLRLQNVIRLHNPVFNLVDIISAVMLVKTPEKSLMNRIGKIFYPHYTQVTDLTFAQMTKDMSQKLKSVISQFWMFTGEVPQNVSGALLSIMLYMFAKDKPVLIKGGMKILAQRLEKDIRKNGGEIHYGKKAHQILTEKNMCKSIILSDQSNITPDFIISTISTHHLFTGLFDKEQLPDQYMKKIENTRLSPSCFQIYIGFPFSLEEKGIQGSLNFFNYSCESQSSTVPSEKTPFVVTNYTAIDLAYSPNGKTSFVIFEMDNLQRWENLTSEQYEKLKLETENLMIEKFEKATGIPIRNTAEVIFSATPMTIKRYTQNTRGEAFGTACTVDQSLHRQTDFLTPFNNLFLTGIYSYCSPGVSSVVDNSYALTKQSMLMMKIIGKKNAKS